MFTSILTNPCVSVPVKWSDIFSLLVSALEGGSNYWYQDLHRIDNQAFDDTDRKRAKAMGLEWDDLTNSLYRAAFVTDGLRCSVPDYDNGPIHDITRERMLEALSLMAQKSPQHFADFIADNADATTGDVFFQYVVLGEVIFG